MKKLFTLFLAGAFAVAGVAQESDEKAKKILDELSAEGKTYTTVEVDFTLVIKGGDMNSTQKGTAKVKEGKYFYETESNKVYSDGETVWTYMVEENECYIDNLEDLDGGINPGEILNIWEDNFKYQYVKEVSETEHEIRLFPKDAKNSKYHTVIITVDTENKRIKQAVIKTKENVLILFTIDDFQPNVEMTDEEFEWNAAKFKGVEEIDNR
jgi:outer membrane lipoprotein-sorting protein